MSSKPNTTRFLTPVLVLTILSQFPHTSLSDNPPLGECPYPCLPPPTSVSGNSYAPPLPVQPGVNYQPPPLPQSQLPPGVAYFYPPPAGGYPSNTPPGGYYGRPAPPPPNPILPYFPWYYRSTNGSSASPRGAGVGLCFVLFNLGLMSLLLF